jgi:hypothetical protein
MLVQTKAATKMFHKQQWTVEKGGFCDFGDYCPAGFDTAHSDIVKR